MSFNQIRKTIEKDDDLSKLLKELEKLQEKGIPLEKQREVAVNRADFETAKNNLIRNMIKKEIEILK